jgi:DNA-binding MarR family transcriptional regulator
MAFGEDSGKYESNLAPIREFELGVLLERARSAYSRMRELELAQYGLTPEQAAVLHVLQSKGGSSTNEELASTIIRQYHSVASLVTRMEKAGLVKKETMRDRNKFTVSITKKGARIYGQVPRNSIKMIFADLSIQDKQYLAKILQNIINKGRNMLGIDQVLPFLSQSNSRHRSEKSDSAE